MPSPHLLFIMKNIKPKLYILLGWGEKITQRNYQSIIKSVSSKFTVVPITLPLFDREYVFTKKSLFGVYLSKANKQIKKPAQTDVILGFSIGALIAYKLATKIKFKKAVICSISPILEKDLNLYPPKEVVRAFTTKQIKELNKTSYDTSISPISIVYGSLEGKECIKRSKALNEINKNLSFLKSVRGSKHRLDGDYLNFVKGLLLAN